MIEVLATNIISPLGFTTQENYQAVKAGKSALLCHEAWKGIPHAFTASLFSKEQEDRFLLPGFTRYESLVIASIKEALLHKDINVNSSRTALVISTTKANVENLSMDSDAENGYSSPAASALKIARHLGFTTQPIVVCNACISGVAAQVLADRLITHGSYDTVVVCGADVQNPFVVSGFMSFKSLSPYACRPFDIERLGLNLGETAATMVFGKDQAPHAAWKMVAGALNNDAYHVSAPSPVGEGAYALLQGIQAYATPASLALLSVHGTATMFNDQMESKAIERAGLSAVPVSAVKGYYGHTLGAAGVVETIVSMESVSDGAVLPVKGFTEIGVSGKVTISSEAVPTTKSNFVKMISGFGGCNGVVLYAQKEDFTAPMYSTKRIQTVREVTITPQGYTINGVAQAVQTNGKSLLTEIYKTHVGDYPKFHKMDVLCKVAFLAAELVCKDRPSTCDANQRAVVLFNHSSSVVADKKHLATIQKADEFYPSPSVFLYTLPNITTGEIAIRHGIKGETSLYILPENDASLMHTIVESTFALSPVKEMITGWVDCSDANQFEANIKLLTIE